MSLQDLIFRNFWLKFFSIALATVIWLTIHYGIHNESTMQRLGVNQFLAQEYIRVPVTIVTAPGDPRVFSITPNEAVVVVVGDEPALRRAANKNFRVTVDLTDFRSKEPASVELQSEAPSDVTVEEITPPAVTVAQVSQQSPAAP